MKKRIYFITTSTKGRKEYFRDEILREIFTSRLHVSAHMHEFTIYAFTILYDHIHLLLGINESSDLRNIIASLKRQFSIDANVVYGFNQPYDIAEKDLSRFPETIRRKIKIHDKMVRDMCKRNMRIRDILPKNKFRWTPSFHCQSVIGEEDFKNHYDYIKNNHEHHGQNKFHSNSVIIYKKKNKAVTKEYSGKKSETFFTSPDENISLSTRAKSRYSKIKTDIKNNRNLLISKRLNFSISKQK